MGSIWSTLFFLAFFFIIQVQAQNNIFNVVNYGAHAGGNFDNSKAFYRAWNQACQSSGPSVVFVPRRTFMVGPMKLKGPCKGPITFHIRGVLTAPTDESTRYLDHWISFQYLDGLSVNGGGSLDGQGPSAWPYSTCKEDPHCKLLPISISFDFVKNSRINNITSINSKGFHIKIFASSNITFDKIRILAPEDSPNTDGIHMGNSNNIKILNSEIATGDDCISMGPGSKNINITNVKCGPGHGISIGSLGRRPNEEDVQGITVTNSNFTDTLNGIRIKTWADHSYPSTVSNITFEHIYVNDTANPILIDQQYCPSKNCTKGASKVGISDVRFRDIWGTTKTKAAVILQCSQSKPCQKIELRDIIITYRGGQEPATSSCSNVHGLAYGQLLPPPCITA